MNWPSSLPEAAPVLDEFAGGRELLDPVVGGVDDIDVPGGVGREPADRPELAVPAAVGAPLAEIGAGGGELLHDERELVGDVDVAERVDCDRLGEAEDAFGAHPDDRGRGVRAFPCRPRTRRGEGGCGRDPRQCGAGPRQREGAGEGGGQPEKRATHRPDVLKPRGSGCELVSDQGMTNCERVAGGERLGRAWGVGVDLIGG